MRLTNINITDRPRPIKAAANGYGRWLGIIGGMVVALVTGGVLTAAQGEAVDGLLGLIPGVITTATTFLAAFGIVRKAEPKVTPLSDPRDDKLRALVALPPNSKIVPKTGPKGDSGNLTGTAGLAGLAAREDAARAAGSTGPFAAHLLNPTPALAGDTDDVWGQDDTGDCDRPRTVADPLPSGETVEVRTWDGDTIHVRGGVQDGGGTSGTDCSGNASSSGGGE